MARAAKCLGSEMAAAQSETMCCGIDGTGVPMRVRDVLVRQLALQAPRRAYDHLSFNAKRTAVHLPAPQSHNRRSAIRHRLGNDALFGSGALALLEQPQASQLAFGGVGSSLGVGTAGFSGVGASLGDSTVSFDDCGNDRRGAGGSMRHG